MAAALEGRDGRVGPALFPTYDMFLSGERDFRTHQKLPNFLERAVANDEWDSVAWFVKIADEHPDALAATGRGDEIENLKNRVSVKLDEGGESVREELKRLADLLGVKK